MKAMILAAGRGQRLQPLTDRTPKALIEVNGRALIEHHLQRLRAAGIAEVVINVAHLDGMIRGRLGDGTRHGLRIRYSDESGKVLETGGGIVRGLPWLGDEAFFVINADVYTDYALHPVALHRDTQAHLVMVDNPPHHPGGDFHLNEGRLALSGGVGLTFAGMGYYTPALFDGCSVSARFPLAEVLRHGITRGAVSGEHYRGLWMDVGTPERLDALRRLTVSSPSGRRSG